MGASKDTRATYVSGTWMGPVAAVWGPSAVWFWFYAMTLDRQHWYDWAIDYSHRHRTQYIRNPLDSVARGLARALRFVPK